LEGKTAAQMVKLRKGIPVTVPSNFIKLLMEGLRKTPAVMILAPGTKILRIIPVQSDNVLKVAISYFTEKTTSFHQDLQQILIEEETKTLYESGLCYTQGPDFYVGYIAHPSLKKPIEAIKKKLEGIQGVKEVEITRIMQNSWDLTFSALSNEESSK
jgi:hypothetical protein